MLTFRRITQSLFFLLFIYLFFQAAFPYEGFIPSDIFLRIDPLIAIASFLTTHKIIASLLFSIVILVLSVFLGRYFCGWICPLGFSIDFSDRIFGWFRKSKSATWRKYRFLKFAILIFVTVSALFSVQLIGLVDPIVIVTRSFTAVGYPLFVFFIEGIFNLLLKIGFFEETLFSGYDFLRDTILPIESIAFRLTLLFAIIFFGILSFGYLAKRFWCRYFCPLGALFGFFASFRLTKGIVTSDRCIDCGKCQRACKMDAINDDFRTHSAIECIECMTCIDVCPVDAISYSLRPRFDFEKTDITKRRFIASAGTSLLTLGLVKAAYPNKTSLGKVVRPPGALNEQEFLDRCVRCQECVKICSSTGGCLQPALLESGWEGIWTPRVDARHGYCEYNCNLCGLVCPTGAIHAMDLKEKKNLRIGLAYFDKSRCIPWYRGDNCLVCEEHCPLPQKAIKFDTREIRKPDGTTAITKLPYIDESLCIGCGICVTKCPVEGPGGIFLTNTKQQRWGEEEIYQFE